MNKFLIGLALVSIQTSAMAYDLNVTFTPHVPSVAGIYQAPAPIAPRPSIQDLREARSLPQIAPMAGVYEVRHGDVPPNGCEARGGGFRIESGRDRGTCVGR